MVMRKFLFLFIITIFLPGTSLASDPIVGTWKLNLEKSDKELSPRLEEEFKHNPLKEQFQIYRESEGGLLELTVSNTFMDGSTMSSKWEYSGIGGKVNRILPEPLPENLSYVYTKLHPGEWILTVMRDGIQFHVMHKIVSKDGNTMGVTRFDTDPQGNIFKFREVLDRQ